MQIPYGISDFKKIREKNVSEDVKKDELNVLFDESGKKGLIEFLLKANDDDLQSVFDKSKIMFCWSVYFSK